MKIVCIRPLKCLLHLYVEKYKHWILPKTGMNYIHCEQYCLYFHFDLLLNMYLAQPVDMPGSALQTPLSSSHWAMVFLNLSLQSKIFEMSISICGKICLYNQKQGWPWCDLFHLWGVYQYLTQSALGVIGNIAFPLSSNKRKLISPPSPDYEFTQNPPVAQKLLRRDVRNVFPRLSHPSPIELIFGWGWDKCVIFIWV